MKTKVIGNILFVASELTLDQLNLLRDSGKNVIKDKEGNQTFGFYTGDRGELRQYALTFDHITTEGKLEASIQLNVNTKDRESYIKDRYAAAICNAVEAEAIIVASAGAMEDRLNSAMSGMVIE
jgi:hypothetical protein